MGFIFLFSFRVEGRRGEREIEMYMLGSHDLRFELNLKLHLFENLIILN